MNAHLTEQQCVVLVVALFCRVHNQVVLSLRLLVLLLIEHLKPRAHTQTHTSIIVNTCDTAMWRVCVCVCGSYVTLQPCGVQSVLQLQQVWQV